MEKIRIMIVGGYSALILVLRGQLEERGYEVYLSDCGNDALAQLKIADFQLIIVHSTRLPDIDAAALIETITHSPAAAHPTHVILCTGHPDNQEPAFTKKYLDAGAERVIADPYDLEKLLQQIHELAEV